MFLLSILLFLLNLCLENNRYIVLMTFILLFLTLCPQPVPKKLCVSSDDDDDEWIGGGEIEDVDSPSPVQVSSRPRRQAKKAIYIVDDSDED